MGQQASGLFEEEKRSVRKWD